MNDRAKLLQFVTVKTEKVKLDCLKNTEFKDMEFTLKELTISENKQYRALLANKEGEDLSESVKFACSKVMIEPEFFTDEEFAMMNGIGEAIVNEIFLRIPTIGLTEDEKTAYYEKLRKYVEAQNEDKEKSEEDQKKQKKKR